MNLFGSSTMVQAGGWLKRYLPNFSTVQRTSDIVDEDRHANDEIVYQQLRIMKYMNDE